MLVEEEKESPLSEEQRALLSDIVAEFVGGIVEELEEALYDGIETVIQRAFSTSGFIETFQRRED